MMFFRKRRELIQEVKLYRNLYDDALEEEVKLYRNLYDDALEEIEDLRRQSFRFQRDIVDLGKVYEEKLATLKKKYAAKSTKKATTKKVVKKTTTRKGVKSK